MKKETKEKQPPSPDQINSIELATPEQGAGHLAESQNRVASGNPEAQQSKDTFEVVGKNVSEDPEYSHINQRDKTGPVLNDLKPTDIKSNPVTFDEIQKRGLHLKKAEAVLLQTHVSYISQHGSDPGEVIVFNDNRASIK